MKPGTYLRAVALAGALLAAFTTPALAEGENVVPMQGNKFLVPDLIIPAGTTVTWVNMDGEQHDVIELNFAFESPLINSGESWSLTFGNPGTYSYVCDLHAQMSGTVTVVAG
jgi:plastocyanin